MKSALWIVLVALMALAIRCHNLQDVFVGRHIYFVEADCYSRMTRVQMVTSGEQLIIKHHDFENWPAGTDPHTTAPLDFLIAGLYWTIEGGMRAIEGLAPGWYEERILSMAKSDSDRTKEAARILWIAWKDRLDLAGAVISPLLGFLTCLFLGWWARWGVAAAAAGESVPRLGIRAAVPVLFAVSPILVHGTLLGRPDHQSLLILVLAVAMGAEVRIAAGPSKAWSIAAGIAWGFALWVSLYEPLILLLVILALWLARAPRRLWERERRPGWIALLVIVIAALAIDGWRVSAPASESIPFLKNWSKSIGELRSIKPTSPLFFTWLGAGWVIAPVLLLASIRWDRRGIGALALLLALYGFTMWQLRWGYFLALAFAMALVWILNVPCTERRWTRWAWRIGLWALFLGSLYPMAKEWDERLFPNAEARRQIALQHGEMQQLREAAERIRGPETVPFLAPWWHSPRIAYWSGQPGVAGSSHQSISGNVESARFYLAEDRAVAGEILKARRVAAVFGDEPGRVISTSRQILGTTVSANPMAKRLIDDPADAAPFLVPTFSNQFYQVFAVDQAKLNP
ncbi:MAG: hypothetical protein ACO1QR_03435 [Chthoniobacteraceae bacterium]